MGIDFAEQFATARDRVFHLLSDLQWHSWRELRKIGGVRYSARILELKRMGYQIDAEPQGMSGRNYRLQELAPSIPQRKRVKVFLEELDALAIVNNRTMPARARAAIQSALASFQTNRGKL